MRPVFLDLEGNVQYGFTVPGRLCRASVARLEDDDKSAHVHLVFYGHGYQPRVMITAESATRLAEAILAAVKGDQH